MLSLALAVSLLGIGTFLPIKTSGHSDQRSKFRRSNQPIPNQYIVVLSSNALSSSVERSEVEAQAQGLSSTYGGEVRGVYSSALQGYSVTMSERQAEALSRDENVEFVEEDSVVSVSTTQSNAGWNLDRIDQRNLPLDTTYSYSQTGAGAHVYIIDTGIRVTHQDFGGRATVAFDALNDGQNGIDCNGHGTHVAGIVGGATFGVAKNVALHSVRVLPCSGGGQISDIISGVDWVTSHRINPAVANISITAAGSSNSMETAITNSIASGVTYTIAAGNNANDACFYTPARTPSAITVGATAQADDRALFSNWGTCVDLFAPGYEIVSAGIANDTDTRQLNGTSMAAPLVAGVAAIYRAANPSASTSTVTQAVLNATTNNIVTNAGTGSTTRLLYSWVATAPPSTPTPTPSPTATPTPSPTVTPAPSPTPTTSAGRITIKKVTRANNGGTSSTATFPYEATNISTPTFTLSGDQEFIDPNAPTGGQMVTVTEDAVQGWQLTTVECVEVAGGSPNIPNTTVDLANHRANIMVESGESVTCTFTSDELAPTAGDATIAGRIVRIRGLLRRSEWSRRPRSNSRTFRREYGPDGLRNHQ